MPDDIMTNQDTNESNPQRCPACNNIIPLKTPYCGYCGHQFASEIPDVDISGWIRAGWKLFIDNIGPAISISLTTLVPVIGFLILGYFGFIATAIISENTRSGEPPTLLLGWVCFLGAIVLLLSLLLPAMLGGVFACFLAGARTGKMDAKNIWVGFHNWWACTWVVLLAGIAGLICIPFIFLFLVGIPLLFLVQLITWLALFHIVDKHQGGCAAIGFAINILHGRFWMLLLFSFITRLLISAGASMMWFGIILTLPVSLAAQAFCYNALMKKQHK